MSAPQQLLIGGQWREGRGPAFDIGTTVPLWGFTAGVISALFRLAGWEKPWDENDARRHPEVR